MVLTETVNKHMQVNNLPGRTPRGWRTDPDSLKSGNDGQNLLVFNPDRKINPAYNSLQTELL